MAVVMSVNDFDTIWRKFDWVIDEMKNGMCFFEGYIPIVGASDLNQPLSIIKESSRSYDYSCSIWANDTSEEDWEQTYEASEYIGFFTEGRIVVLHFNYEYEVDGIMLNQKLMFDRNPMATSLEIICYREAILESGSPKDTVATAISEFRRLKRLFQGDSLFIGPDTLDYPKSSNDYPGHWLKIN